MDGLLMPSKKGITQAKREEREAVMRKQETEIRECLTRVAMKCAETLEDLYRPVGDPKRHPDADKTWAECSMQTRAAIHLAKVTEQNPEKDIPAVCGLIIVSARVKSIKEWEQKALAVEAEQRRKAREAAKLSAIDAEATPVEPREAVG
jgi:hypothetical protein